jgi:hypothetical protein
MAQLATGMVHAFVGTGEEENEQIDTRQTIYVRGEDKANPNFNLPIPGTGNTKAYYLGTCEQMPQDTRQFEYAEVMTDRTGVKVPFDMAWQGATAQISLTLTRVIQSTVEMLLQNPTSLNVRGGAPGLLQASQEQGSWTSRDVGTMMALEGWTWQLYLVYQFTGISQPPSIVPKQAYLTQGLRMGRRYPQCILFSPQSEETGSRPMKTHLMFYAWPAAQSGQNGTAIYTLYDYNIPANIGQYIQ